MKKSKKDDRVDLVQLAVEMFIECPVWKTTDFDGELTKRWEAETKRSIAEYGTLKSGRNRFLNLVDWVKAHFTMQGFTFKVEVGGEEYRVVAGTVGKIRGEGLIPFEHVVSITEAALLYRVFENSPGV